MMKRNLWTVLFALVLVSTATTFAGGGGGGSGGNSGGGSSGSGSGSYSERNFIRTLERKSKADARASNALKCFSFNGVLNGGTFKASVEARTSTFPIYSIYMQHNVRMSERIENPGFGDTYLGRSKTITRDERANQSNYFRDIENTEYEREFGCYRFNPASAVLDGLLAKSFHKAIATNAEGGHRHQFYDEEYDRFN